MKFSHSLIFSVGLALYSTTAHAEGSALDQIRSLCQQSQVLSNEIAVLQGAAGVAKFEGNSSKMISHCKELNFYKTPNTEVKSKMESVNDRIAENDRLTNEAKRSLDETVIKLENLRQDKRKTSNEVMETEKDICSRLKRLSAVEYKLWGQTGVNEMEIKYSKSVSQCKQRKLYP